MLQYNIGEFSDLHAIRSFNRLFAPQMDFIKSILYYPVDADYFDYDMLVQVRS